MECASWTVRFSRSTMLWNASAPATRVTGSMLTSLMYPLRAINSWMRSSRSNGWPLAWYAYGFATPARRWARPCSSNSIGKFLKHIRPVLLLSAGAGSRSGEQLSGCSQVFVDGRKTGCDSLRSTDYLRQRLSKTRQDVAQRIGFVFDGAHPPHD